MKDHIYVISDKTLSGKIIADKLKEAGYTEGVDLFVTQAVNPSWNALEPEIKAALDANMAIKETKTFRVKDTSPLTMDSKGSWTITDDIQKPGTSFHGTRKEYLEAVSELKSTPGNKMKIREFERERIEQEKIVHTGLPIYSVGINENGADQYKALLTETSIEKIQRMEEIKLSLEEQFVVVAEDLRYGGRFREAQNKIEKMMDFAIKLGMTQEESSALIGLTLKSIRTHNGITQEQETQAAQAYASKQIENGIIIVDLPHNKAETITDRIITDGINAYKPLIIQCKDHVVIKDTGEAIEMLRNLAKTEGFACQKVDSLRLQIVCPKDKAIELAGVVQEHLNTKTISSALGAAINSANRMGIANYYERVPAYRDNINSLREIYKNYITDLRATDGIYAVQVKLPHNEYETTSLHITQMYRLNPAFAHLPPKAYRDISSFITLRNGETFFRGQENLCKELTIQFPDACKMVKSIEGAFSGSCLSTGIIKISENHPEMIDIIKNEIFIREHGYSKDKNYTSIFDKNKSALQLLAGSITSFAARTKEKIFTPNAEDVLQSNGRTENKQRESLQERLQEAVENIVSKKQEKEQTNHEECEDHEYYPWG